MVQQPAIWSSLEIRERTAECRSVEGLTDETRWAPIFEDPAFNIRVVQRPFHAQSGGEFLGLEPA